jgi:hypothetical protein
MSATVTKAIIHKWSIYISGDVSFTYYDDGTYYYRIGIRDNYFVIDKRLTASPGFAGTENIDWENVEATVII